MGDAITRLSGREKLAIERLKKASSDWPNTLWVFAANGCLFVMRNDANGNAVMDGIGYDSNSIVATINIPADGGDW